MGTGTDAPDLDFGQVYEAYHTRVLQYATKLIGRDAADDVAQEVFVRVAQNLGSLKDPSKLTSWIYAITINAVRDTARKRAAQGGVASACAGCGEKGRDQEDPLSRLVDLESRTPEEAAMRKEMVECYVRYVERLPPNYYEVYVLREFEHLSNEEIAGRLGLSLDTVKIRLHRARSQLYEELRQDCEYYYNERGEPMGGPKSDSNPPADSEKIK